MKQFYKNRIQRKPISNGAGNDLQSYFAEVDTFTPVTVEIFFRKAKLLQVTLSEQLCRNMAATASSCLNACLGHGCFNCV